MNPQTRTDERRVIPNMTLCLMEGLIRMTRDDGLFYLCAVMERPLLRLLERLGIHFTSPWPPVQYHGLRQPSTLELETMLREVRAQRLGVRGILTDRARH